MIAALVNYYDEGPELMIHMVGQLAKLNVDTIVAVEGPYALYPKQERIYRYDEELWALEHAVAYHGMQLHQFTRERWLGNEVEKRQFALDCGIELGAHWFLIWDADFVVDDEQSGPHIDLQSYARSWPKDFGDCMIYDARGSNPPWRNRPFLRYRPGMHYTVNHHSIMYPGPIVISTGMVSTRHTVPATNHELGDLLPITIRHDRGLRSELRCDRQQSYYDERDRLKVEG
jgi:hypothetical protein